MYRSKGEEMKKIVSMVILCTASFIESTVSRQPLGDTPETIECYKEIALVYNQRIAQLYNNLTPQGRVLSYFLFRASLPGNRIMADQLNRDAVEITEIFENILCNKDLLIKKVKTDKVLRNFDMQQFLTNATVYLVYLWTNHGQYFRGECSEEKRTPNKLELDFLTKENLITILKVLDYKDAEEVVERLTSSLFNAEIESTLTVPNSIDKSSVNFYSKDFTDDDFQKLDAVSQQSINAYAYIDCSNGNREPKIQRYKIEGKYDRELSVSYYWLNKAYEYALRHSDQFDNHFTQSLAYLCDYIRTGDEKIFKKHSREWLKTNNRIDYVWGFIETYDDPKAYRGTFEADVTIKSIDINKLNAILPQLEDRLPFPATFKRENLYDGTSALPNASINTKLFGAGELGPLNTTAAYCLPNYKEIRSQYGSKQIIYHLGKGIGELSNPDLHHRLFNCNERFGWFREFDPDFQIDRDIWTLQVILHETLGHGSGRLDMHTFKEGDELTIEGKTYKIGDSIPVTSSNIQQFLAGYDHTIEELRAEIIALLSSIISYDELAESGLLGMWPDKIEKPKMLTLLIEHMARIGLRRFLLQQENAQVITGDHARANVTILYYLIDHGDLELIKEQVTVDDKNYAVLDVGIHDLQKTIEAIKDLAIQVQTIASTGDGVAAKHLIDTYGKPIRNPGYIKIMHTNRKAVVGDIKLSGTIYPDLEPIIDEAAKEIVDINATWPSNIIDQYMKYRELMLSTDY